MRAADYIIDMGPGAGEHGGARRRRRAPSTRSWRAEDSLTGAYLSGRRQIPLPERAAPRQRRRHRDPRRAREQPQEHRRRHPARASSSCVTGVSGSGKSTLITEILYKKAAQDPLQRARPPRRHDSIKGIEHIDKVDRRRPVADRPHAALEPGDLHRPVHADPRAVRVGAGSAAARLHSPGASPST